VLPSWRVDESSFVSGVPCVISHNGITITSNEWLSRRYASPIVNVFMMTNKSHCPCMALSNTQGSGIFPLGTLRSSPLVPFCIQEMSYFAAY
jgi:hypothetical protein